MIWYFLSIFLLIAILRVNNVLSKKILYPPLYLNLLWIVLIIIHLFFLLVSDYTPNKLSFASLLFFTTAVAMFSFGGIIAKGLSKNKNKIELKFYFKNSLLLILCVINLIFLVLYFQKVKELTGNYWDLRMFRYYTSVERVNIGIIKYSVTFSVFISIVTLISYLNKPKSSFSLLFITLLSTFMITFLTGSRGTIFFLILSCLGTYSAFRKVNTRLLLKVISITLVAFITLATILKKATPNAYYTNKSYSAVEKVEYFIYSYSTLPLSAFDKFINEPYDISYGDIAFRFPMAILNKIGVIDREPQKLVEKYVEVPDKVNVFTAYYKMIKDFGIIYSFLLMLFLGCIHSYFFFNMKRSFKYLIGYITLIFPLSMTFFEDNYLSILSVWIQVYIYTFILERFLICENE
jgi:oligosaccharide repeat unit polymerase